MERLKNSRAASFAVVTLVYILATVLGVAVYNALNCDMWLKLLAADVSATVLTFVFSVLFKNASVYDPYWSVQPLVILAAFSFNAKLSPCAYLMLFQVFFWGVRLTANWVYTFHGLKYQDWRYTKLDEKTGKAYPVINFVGIHLVPTLIVYGCTLPAVYVIMSGKQANIGSVLFCLVSLCAASMQGVADIQMHKFRKGATGGFIRSGLWKYSRHPNYLGEIMMWWGVCLSALSVMPQNWWFVSGALANTVLFFLVSIPMAEKKQSLKPDYDEYRAQTRMLLPLKKQTKELAKV